jgi:hypothetical protein
MSGAIFRMDGGPPGDQLLSGSLVESGAVEAKRARVGFSTRGRWRTGQRMTTILVGETWRLCHETDAVTYTKKIASFSLQE